MSAHESAANSPLSLPDSGPDPDLEALPPPRRPGRTLTLVTMSVTLLASLIMAWALRGAASYALSPKNPQDLGNLAHVQAADELANRYVEGDALLSSGSAIRYTRPLETDTFRLAHVAGNEQLWVEIRVPKGEEGPHFVPPTRFQGRLVPFDDAGLSHSDLQDSVSQATAGNVPANAWVLIDGDAPAGSQWALGLIALFVGFALFNAGGLQRLLRPARQ